MASFANATSEDLLKSVVGIVTSAPKKTIKNFFVRHSAAADQNLRDVQKSWAAFSKSFDVFRPSFAKLVDDSADLQRQFVQLAVVSALMGRIDADNDENGLYAGAALYVSEWCAHFSGQFFPECSPISFFSIWSSLLNTFGVDWRFHGPLEVVLVSLLQQIEDEDEPFALLFPGPPPAEKWSAVQKSLPDDSAEAFSRIFGLTGKISSRHIMLYNPADETIQMYRKADKCWAIDIIRPPPDVEEFEREEAEEDAQPFNAELAKLQSLVGVGSK